MILFPAIDLLQGKCVRLYQGDYNQPEQVSGDPVETAKRFLDEGATHLHVVDLDGAKSGDNINFPIIEKLCSLGLNVQTGGGIRDTARIVRALNAGAKKVILGSAAVTDRNFLLSALKNYRDNVIVGIDALNGEVKTAGWLLGSGLHYIDFAKELEAIGVKNIIFTDISKDGTLSGVNAEALLSLQRAVKIDITASGGVKDINDIDTLIRLGVYGAICGKSLYNGTLSLSQAIRRVKCSQNV